MKPRKLSMFFLRCLSLVPAIILLSFIFRFSSQTGSHSDSLSMKVSEELVTASDKLLSRNRTKAEVKSSAVTINALVRKAAHVTEYFLLSFCIFLPVSVFLKKGGFSFRRRLLLCFCLCFLFSALDELRQTSVPGRSGNGIDVSIDSIGNLSACLILFVFGGRKSRKEKRSNRITIPASAEK